MLNIKINKAQCTHCRDILVSEFLHDFKTCSCGALSVDGGTDYLRRGGNKEDYIELSVFQYEDMYPKLQEYLSACPVEIHAIYDPDGVPPYGDFYCAAVDLFKSGETFKVYFTIDENGEFYIHQMTRWFFG